MRNYRGSHNTIFNYNSDFSGEVIIFDTDGNEFRIPGRDILEFVVIGYILPQKIRRIEQTSCDEFITEIL